MTDRGGGAAEPDHNQGLAGQAPFNRSARCLQTVVCRGGPSPLSRWAGRRHKRKGRGLVQVRPAQSLSSGSRPSARCGLSSTEEIDHFAYRALIRLAQSEQWARITRFRVTQLGRPAQWPGSRQARSARKGHRCRGIPSDCRPHSCRCPAHRAAASALACVRNTAAIRERLGGVPDLVSPRWRSAAAGGACHGRSLCSRRSRRRTRAGALPASDQAVTTLLRHARRTATRRRLPPPPMARLTRMATACPGDLAGLRDRALLLLASAGLHWSALTSSRSISSKLVSTRASAGRTIA